MQRLLLKSSRQRAQKCLGEVKRGTTLFGLSWEAKKGIESVKVSKAGSRKLQGLASGSDSLEFPRPLMPAGSEHLDRLVLKLGARLVHSRKQDA